MTLAPTRCNTQNVRYLYPILLIGLLLPACREDELADDDTSEAFDPIDEYGQDDDSAAADDDDDDDDDSAEPTADVTSLTLQPESYVVDTATTFPLTATATWDDDTTGRVVPDWYTVGDPTVAAIDTEGVVTPFLEGETTVVATYDGVDSNTATLTVVAPGSMTVLVVASDTGDPLEGAELIIGSTDEPVAYAVTDVTGYAELIGDFSGPLSVHCKAGGHYRTSICGVTTRNLRFPVVPKEDDVGTVEGTAVWTQEADMDEIQLGFSAASFKGNPVLFDFAELMGEDRTIDVMGYELEAPANVVVGGSAEGFQTPGRPGPTSVMAMTGTFEMEDVYEAIESQEDGSVTSALVYSLADQMIGLDFTMLSGLEIVSGETLEVGELQPYTSVSEMVPVVVPMTPLGFGSDDTPVVFPLAEVPGEGLVLVGLGAGSGGVVVLEAPRQGPLEGLEARYVAIIEVDGIGNGNARSAIISDRVAEGGAVLFPDFLDLTILDTPTEMDYTWTYTGDPDADLFFATLEGAAITWHVWARGDTESFALDYIDPRAGLSHTYWHMTAMGLPEAVFETLIHDDGPGIEEAIDRTHRQSCHKMRYHIDIDPEEPEE